MLKRILKLSTIALFLLGSLIVIPSRAQAAITASLDRSNEMVNVVTVYPTTPTTQAEVLSDLEQEEKTAFSNIPGFQDSSILKAQDGTQVIALSQWKGKDLSTFQVYADEHVLNLAAAGEPKTFACQVEYTETRTTAPSFQKGDVIMFSQFKMKPGKAQSELATVVAQMMPGVMQMTPGLQWAAMCPSTDKSTIALLARWNSTDDFKSLGKQPGFDRETNYWQDYASNEHGLYDVAQVIR